jgi:DNA invertase Pin-like site-specific DNA recombinase
MLNGDQKKPRRSFQPTQKTSQDDMWYSTLPVDVMWGIYARQSTPAQVLKNFESTEMRTDDLIAYLIKRGVKDGSWQLFDADLGLSGTLPIDKRTGLQELVEWIEAGKIKAVLVYQISRLFRDDTGVEYNTFAKICREHDCILVTADGMVFNFNNRMHLKMFRFLAEYAAEYIPQQIGLLNAARMRKARRGLFVGFGYVARGYIVDYDKDSENYQRFVLYKPWQPAVFHLFERFYALGGDLSTLCREVDEMPFVFPAYESWVDKRNIRDQTWKKVPGGYHITRRGIISILTNPFYIGWLIVGGDVITIENHEPLIPKEKQYLFWFAFDCLAEFTIQGERNAKRILGPPRFTHRINKEGIGLLKDRVQTPEGHPIYVHVSQSEGHHGKKPTYRTPNRNANIYRKFGREVDIALVDGEFTTLLFRHLRQTHDFDGFRQWVTEVLTRRQSQQQIIQAQLEEVKIQQEAILDERLGIRAQIAQQLRAAVVEDEHADVDQLKAYLESLFAKDIERLQARSQKLDQRERELKAKLPSETEDEQTRVARTFADFQTELENLADVWDKKPGKEKKEFVNLLVTKVELSTMATHWTKCTIYWTHPAWPVETLYIYKRRGGINAWTAEEHELVRLHYPDKPKHELLALLPDKSWTAIEMQAHKLQVRRKQKPNPLNIDGYTTWSDYLFCQQLGIAWETKETMYVQEGSSAKCVPLSTLVISP